MIETKAVPNEVIKWGQTAKVDLVNRTLAAKLANDLGIKLIGLTGTQDGIIGAMAGVGLRASGNDGRFVSLGGVDIRGVTGVHTVKEIKSLIGIEKVVTLDGSETEESTKICFTNGWLRPALKNGLVTIVLNKIEGNGEYSYELASKDYIKSISN
jgi:hypothetical protein